MPQIITFGTIVLYKEKEYVFLVRTEDITYAAEILDQESSVNFKKLRSKTAKNSKESYKLKQSLAYCFVELKTKEYEERIAHYGYPQIGDTSETVMNPIGILCDQDIKDLHREISAEDLAVSAELRELIQNIKIAK